MAHINWLGGLKAEYHHVKIKHSEKGFMPVMLIKHERFRRTETKPGRSFIISQEALWKYIEPMSYGKDETALAIDRQDFNEIKLNIQLFLRGILPSGIIVNRKLTQDEENEVLLNVEACTYAETLYLNSKIMLCTGYNLVKCLQMFEVSISPQSISQLLLWIQDKLDYLKNMEPFTENDIQKTVIGEGTIKTSDGQTFTNEITVSEVEAIEQGEVIGVE